MPDRQMVLRRLIGTKSRPVLLIAALLLAACSNGSENARPTVPALQNSEISRVYRLGVGDKVKITVFGEQDLSGQFEIGALGTVAIPLVGEIPAKGKSIQEFRHSVVRALQAGYLKDPKVNVEVTNYRSFFVHGEVRTGGELQFKTNLRLRDAVAMAGGYTYRANKNYVILIREGEGVEREIPLPSDLIVMPGDNIRIPERFF
ncbi:MAG: polysaccharide export protein [Hyphomicrobiaceae bacterium]|nr:MAG: polysaccharide export protein [Hyphomicrobiaceae bacterium]